MKKILLSYLCLLASCSINSNSEFFCESQHLVISGGDDYSYRQQVVKISNDEYCINWIGNNPTCIQKGKIFSEDWKNNEKYKIRSKESFQATEDENQLIITISEITEPLPNTVVERKLIKGEWQFTFDSVIFPLKLSEKKATPENLKTFDLMAIENVVTWNGKMIQIPDEPLPEFVKNRYSLNEILFNDAESWNVGGSNYKSRYKLANNEIRYRFVFDKKNLLLITGPIDDEIYERTVYQCKPWEKMKWYNF